MRIRTGTRSAVMLLALAALGCGGGGGGGGAPSGPSGGGTQTPPPPPGPPNSVVITNNSFTPADLNVARNATVTWTWDSCSGGDGYGVGQTCVSHSVVFDDGATGSGAQSSGAFSRTFAAAGTYQYHCSLHGSSMSGRVIVQ